MDADSTFDALGAEIRELESSIHESRSALRRSSRTAVLISFILCLTVSAFLFLNYITLSTSWASESFGHSMKRELREFSPTLMNHVNELGQNLLPVYVEEARQQLAAASPELSLRLQAEVGEFKADLTQTLHEELETMQIRVTDRALREIYANFPNLAADRPQHDLAERLHATMEQSLVEALLTLEERFVQDFDRIQSSLLQLDLNDCGESTLDLQKRFLQLWLRLLDLEIMEF